MGAEIEFILVDGKTSEAIDHSVFANTTTLNEQDEFINDLYDQLQYQSIPIELIHSESGECSKFCFLLLLFTLFLVLSCG